MPKPTVLLTGATGHIGFRTLVLLLQANYAVRVAIRSPEQEIKIRDAASVQPHVYNIEFTVVPDMAAPNAYDAAIEGMQYVIHIASPVPLKANNRALTNEGKSWTEVYYRPAIQGTLNILKAAKATPSVRRVVITASGNVLATVVGEPGARPSDIRRCPSIEEAEAVQIAGQAYKMSKILAVTAAREFMRSERCHFSTVYTCPGYVQGAHELTNTVDDLATTTSVGTLSFATGAYQDAPNVDIQIWIDDVANAHIASLSSEQIVDGDVLVLVGNGGQGWRWSEVGTLIGEMFPKELEDGLLKPATDRQSMALKLDAKETEKKLGWKFSGPDIWAKEVVEQYLILRSRQT